VFVKWQTKHFETKRGNSTFCLILETDHSINLLVDFNKLFVGRFGDRFHIISSHTAKTKDTEQIRKI